MTPATTFQMAPHLIVSIVFWSKVNRSLCPSLAGSVAGEAGAGEVAEGDGIPVSASLISFSGHLAFIRVARICSSVFPSLLALETKSVNC